jgi:hypothetical protein
MIHFHFCHVNHVHMICSLVFPNFWKYTKMADRRLSNRSSDVSNPSSPISVSSPHVSAMDGSSCVLCRSEFGVTRRKHRCRVCGATVCGSCSSTRIRISSSGEKERACDICANESRAAHVGDVEESVDIRIQMNESLKMLLKEKFEEIEDVKKGLVQLIDAQPFLQEAPSLTAPFRFSSSMGTDRIDFSDLVRYLDSKLQHLYSRAVELEQAVATETVQQAERRRNFGFLKERTQKAEADALRVSELVEQRDRLREIFREQAVKLRSLKDRVDFLEESDSRQQNPIEPTEELFEFIGDELVQKYCPCIP